MSTELQSPEVPTSVATIGVNCCRAGRDAVKAYMTSFLQTWAGQRKMQAIHNGLKESGVYDFQGNHAQRMAWTCVQKTSDQLIIFRQADDFKMTVTRIEYGDVELEEGDAFQLHISVAFFWQSNVGDCRITTKHHHVKRLCCSSTPFTISTSEPSQKAAFIQSGWLLESKIGKLAGDADTALPYNSEWASYATEHANSSTISEYGGPGGPRPLSGEESLNFFNPSLRENATQVTGSIVPTDQTVSHLPSSPVTSLITTLLPAADSHPRVTT